MELTNQIAIDGSRWFLALPETVSWYKLRDHIARLSGAEVTDFLTDHVTEAWIDFQYRGHTFSINNQFGEYWFFATDPACPEGILQEIAAHSAGLLRDSRQQSSANGESEPGDSGNQS